MISRIFKPVVYISTDLLLVFLLFAPLPSSFPTLLAPHTQDYVVSKTVDELDGPCSPGDCSLREAIQSANQNPGRDRITFLQAGTYLLNLAGKDENQNQSGDLDILDSLILSGENIVGDVIIDGNQIDRVFHITSTVEVSITGITIQNGEPSPGDLLGGGGILVEGSLQISDTLVLSNTAYKGGGVSGTETALISISNTIFDHNSTPTDGGAIYNDKNADLTDVTLSNNQAYQGGGIYSDGDSTFRNVTIDDNHAGSGGAGVFISSGTYFFENVTISANLSTDQGGGIYNDGLLTLQNVTLANNRSLSGDNLYQTVNGETTLQNTLLVGGLGDNCAGDTSFIHSKGYNLESLNTCRLVATGDQKKVSDPGLAPLDYNLGKTKTHALLPGSPAIDAGSPSGCVDEDQRYVVRPVDGDGDAIGACDIGAFELVTRGFVAFNPLEYYTNEPTGGSAQVTFFVTRSGSSERVEVDYLLTTPTVDVLPASGTLRWPGGDINARPFNVTVLDDEFAEGDEVLTVRLINPRYGVGMIAPGHVAFLTIWANDPGGPLQPPIIYLPFLRVK